MRSRRLPIVAVLTAIATLVLAALAVRDCYQALPDFRVELRELTVIRPDTISVPSMVLEFEVENRSTAQHTISFNSLTLVAFNLRHNLRSDSRRVAVAGKTTTSVLVSEQSLFSDTVLALPFDSTTALFAVDIQWGDQVRTLKYDDSRLEKALFVQTPKFQHALARPHLVGVLYRMYHGDTFSDVSYSVSRATAPFLKVSLTYDATATYFRTENSYDSLLFSPRYGGLFYCQTPGYVSAKDRISAASLFSPYSLYDLIRSGRAVVDSNVFRSDEFLTLQFSDNVVLRTSVDAKLKAIQYVITQDSLSRLATGLRDQLLASGYRTEIREGSLLAILNYLRDNGCPDIFQKLLPEPLEVSIFNINNAVSKRVPIVLDLEKDLFLDSVLATLAAGDSGAPISLKYQTPAGYILFRDRPFAETSRVFFIDTRDTIAVSLDGWPTL